MTPSPLTMSPPLSLSHCRIGLADNPSTVLETKQRMLRLLPKLGADTDFVEILIAVFGTAKESKQVSNNNVALLANLNTNCT